MLLIIFFVNVLIVVYDIFNFGNGFLIFVVIVFDSVIIVDVLVVVDVVGVAAIFGDVFSFLFLLLF